MHRRRFAFGAASAAATHPLFGLAGCGGGDSSVTPDDGPKPVPASASVIRLPADQYLHRGAPTEWWWHTGTLKAGKRTFGFEINAASFAKDGYAFTQIMLSDVANNRQYQRTTVYVPPFLFEPDTWAQSDPSEDWSVDLGYEDKHLSALELIDSGSGYTSDPVIEFSGGGGILAAGKAVRDPASGKITAVLLLAPGLGFTSVPTVTITGGGGTGATARALHTYVSMRAPQANPTQNMAVKALLIDEKTQTPVLFDLSLSQQGPPFIVWGTGVNPEASSTTPGIDLQHNNYYYSLNRLQTHGSITLNGEKLDVTGVTWMDHEYGAFGTAANPVQWILQDMQLDNGVCISNYATLSDGLPALNQKTQSQATVQNADGTTYFVHSFITPLGRTWTSDVSGKTFYMQIQVDIPDFKASMLVTSLMDSQEFPVPGRAVYEGVASASGTFQGLKVSGTAWSEQAL